MEGNGIGGKYRKNYEAISRRRRTWRAVGPFVCAVPYFLAVALQAPSSIKGCALVLTAALLLTLIPRFATLRNRITPPLLCLCAIVALGGVSCFYAVASKLALNEFVKLLCALCLTLLLLAWADKSDGKSAARQIATVLAGFAALASFFSIDLLSTHIFSGALKAVLGLFTPEYAALEGLEAGVRMTSIFENPNIFAGTVGLGVLLSLGLAGSSESEKERAAHVALLYVSALGFVLAFSLGASGFIALAFLAYIALESKEKRPALVVLMVETLVLALAGAALTSMTAFDGWTGYQPVPLLCALVGAAALIALDRYVGRRAAEFLAGKGKAALIAAGCVLAALIVYAAAAVLVTGPADLGPGESLRRAAYPAPGDYVLAVEADGPVSVTVESQDRRETMMHESTVLYAGDAADAAFTVPEDSLVVYFNFAAPEGARVASAAFGGYSVPLDYKLLPAFIANRLQGLFANENAIQRTVFFSDGLKMFAQRPVFGLGLGAFANSIAGVQSFYYETNYAHNHYIQTLAETGLAGLLLFLALLAVSAVSLVLSRRREGFHPLVPALGAAWVFMAGHAAVELVFSSFTYLPVAFGVFALIGLCCPGTLPKPEPGKAARTGILAGASAFCAAFAVLIALNLAAARLVERERSFEAVARAAEMDKFGWADYMLTYVNGAERDDIPDEVRDRADAYALRLETLDSNIIPYYLAEYYYYLGRPDKAAEMLEKYLAFVSADPAAWERAFGLMMANEYLYHDGLAEGADRLARMLDDWNAAHMGDITLGEEARAFVERMRAYG